MRKRSKSEMMRLSISKVVRGHIRMKHTLAAEDEINEVLPRVLAEYDRCLQTGTEFSLDTNKLPQ